MELPAIGERGLDGLPGLLLGGSAPAPQRLVRRVSMHAPSSPLHHATRRTRRGKWDRFRGAPRVCADPPARGRPTPARSATLRMSDVPSAKVHVAAGAATHAASSNPIAFVS